MHRGTSNPGKRTPSSSKIILLLGGGIDSTTLAGMYRKHGLDFIGVHYDYGQPSLAGERKALARISRRYRFKPVLRTLSKPVTRKADEFLCRNALFILSAAAEFGLDGARISIGAHDQAPYYDCSPRFFSQIQEVLDGHFQGRVLVETPLIQFNKSDVVAYARRLRVPLESTFSCTRLSRSCGSCPSCLDRRALNV